MKASLLVVCAFVVPAAAPAAVIQTGLFNKPHDASPVIQLGVQLGGTYHLEIALDKNPGSIDGEYRLTYVTSSCQTDYLRPECSPNESPKYINRKKVNDLPWTVDFSLPQAGSPVLPGAPRYINAVRDNGIFFAGMALDQQTFDNYPIYYTISGGAVPEPASWAMMIGGFGILGAEARRTRKPSVAFG